MHVFMYLCMCHTGVVYDNISIVFVLWALSINNKVGLVLLFKISICFDLQKMVIQSVLNLELNLWYQNNNTLLITKHII